MSIGCKLTLSFFFAIRTRHKMKGRCFKMTRTQMWLILWTIWTILGPIGMMLDILMDIIIGRISLNSAMVFIHDEAIEAVKEGSDNIFSDNINEVIAIFGFILCFTIPFIGWISVIGHIKSVIKRHHDEKELSN